ncbi:phage/plasmid primase, P4 family [Candidatus Soleaferrea massiliensis]|uniref:phage/plasmid primase, P4 family n=1 Tax=Candidatus Soleaferrea massiliensis TaxID=1470354 RepID=UPI0009E1FEDE|nr:phage/plasmid primase, P4 family [Candidatus Soleaferrea massiliensis]
MKALSIPLEEFLRPFFDASETVCLRIFDDRKTGAFRGQKLECEAGKIAAMVDTLKKHNKQNRGIYFVVNYGGHEDADITRINAQFVECDELSIEEQMAQIEAFPIEPSLIVKTRKSLHNYWLLKDAKVADFRRVQKRLIARFHGDPACVNESRVLRLPGFYHCKNEPIMVECIKFNPELRYTQAELEAALPEVPDDPVIKAPAPKGTRKGLALVGKRCLFVQHCRDNAKTLPEHDWYSMITNLAVFEGGDLVIHTLSKPYPGYKRAETQEKINHFLESGTKPITCRRIAEKGFVCPKMEDGSCGCKSPAALCYKALSVEELRVFLSELEIRRSAVDDMQTAQDFVRDYLYNVDSVVAGTFIEYELKEHFGLKTSAVKPLVAQQKELYKAYRDNKDTKRETSGEELPDWYEVTDRGLHFVSGLLANHMAKNVDAFYGAESYYLYESGVYKATSDLQASAKVREHLIGRYATMSAINDTEGQWRMLIYKPIREINCNPFIINAANGLYNVLDGSFKPHTPEYYSTVQLKAAYRENAGCHKFMKFIKSVLQEPEVYLLQEILGYFLIPVNKAQKSFVLVGAPNAGKSTLLSIVQEILLGSENVSNVPWQSLSDRFKTAELFGKLANIFADLPSKSVDDNGIFKALTGEDYITAERKNKNPFSFKPYARLLFSCNEIPRNYGDRSEGFYRRLIIIRFENTVPPEKRDPNLLDKLAVERDGIFMWALTGLKRLMANSYIFSETDATRAELQRYKVESNSVLSFVEDCCELDENAESIREELFQQYREYCNKNGLKPMSQANFNKDIESLGERVERGFERVSRRKTWRGIRMI